MRSLAPVLAICMTCCFGVAAETGQASAKQAFDFATQALNAGNYSAAEAGFRKVLHMDPHNVSALANLGVLYAKTHRYGKAIEAYQEVLRVQPGLRAIQLDL